MFEKLNAPNRPKLNARIATTHNRLLGDTLLRDMYEGAKLDDLLRSATKWKLRKWQHIVTQNLSAEQVVRIQEPLPQRLKTTKYF